MVSFRLPIKNYTRMNPFFLNTRSVLSVIASVLTVVSADAQKLPVKQEGSMRAAANVKIDGKANEWTFKAYSNAIDVFYAVAHDDENIYLAVKATDEYIVRKILSGGITFVVNSVAKKSDDEAATLRYPLFSYKNKPDVKFSLRNTPADSIDYVVSANNKSITNKGKFLRVRGITGVDTLLSVYNSDGISVASAFDKEMAYTYELALARKHIKNALDANGRFSYKIILNSITFDDTPGVAVTRDATGVITAIHINKSNLPPNPNPSMSATTDVSGEYSLK